MDTQYPMNPYGQPALVPNRGAVPPAVIVNQPVGVVDPKILKQHQLLLLACFAISL